MNEQEQGHKHISRGISIISFWKRIDGILRNDVPFYRDLEIPATLLADLCHVS